MGFLSNLEKSEADYLAASAFFSSPQLEHLRSIEHSLPSHAFFSTFDAQQDPCLCPECEHAPKTNAAAKESNSV